MKIALLVSLCSPADGNSSNSIGYVLCTKQSISASQLSQLSQYLSCVFAYVVPPKKALPPLLYI